MRNSQDHENCIQLLCCLFLLILLLLEKNDRIIWDKIYGNRIVTCRRCRHMFSWYIYLYDIVFFCYWNWNHPFVLLTPLPPLLRHGNKPNGNMYQNTVLRYLLNFTMKNKNARAHEYKRPTKTTRVYNRGRSRNIVTFTTRDGMVRYAPS